MYEVASGLLEVFSAVFQGYCLQYFFGSFLEIRIRNRRIGVLAVTALYGVLRLGMGFFLPKGYTSFWVFARLAVILCIVSVTALVFYRAVGKITLFLIVTFMAVGEMSFFLAHMFFELGSHLFRLWNQCLEKGYISSFNYSKIVNITIIFNQILFCVIGAAVLYFTLRRVVQDYREKEYAVHRTERCHRAEYIPAWLYWMKMGRLPMLQDQVEVETYPDLRKKNNASLRQNRRQRRKDVRNMPG